MAAGSGTEAQTHYRAGQLVQWRPRRHLVRQLAWICMEADLCAPPLAQSKTVLWEGRAQAQSLVFEASVALAKDLGAPAAVITKASNLWKHDGPLQPVL